MYGKWEVIYFFPFVPDHDDDRMVAKMWVINVLLLTKETTQCIAERLRINCDLMQING